MNIPSFDYVTQEIDYIATRLEAGDFEGLAAICNASNQIAVEFYNGKKFLSVSPIGRL